MTTNLPFENWTEVLGQRAVDRGGPGSAHPPLPHPGDQGRKLPPPGRQTPPPTEHLIALRRHCCSRPPTPTVRSSLPNQRHHFRPPAAAIFNRPQQFIKALHRVELRGCADESRECRIAWTMQVGTLAPWFHLRENKAPCAAVAGGRRCLGAANAAAAGSEAERLRRGARSWAPPGDWPGVSSAPAGDPDGEWCGATSRPAPAGATPVQKPRWSRGSSARVSDERGSRR